MNLWRSAVGIACTFFVATGTVYLLGTFLADKLDESGALSFPTTVDDLRQLVSSVYDVKRTNSGLLLVVFSAAYLYKQTFAIPGSALLNVLGGALYGVWLGLPLVCLLSATGASLCFLLSRIFGRDLVNKYFGDRLGPLREELTSDRNGMLLVLLSMRLFPATPNWLLNLAAPQLNVPLLYFFFSVLIGLIPYNFLCIQAGITLAKLQSLSSLMDWRSMLSLGTSALMVFLLAIGVRKLGRPSPNTVGKKNMVNLNTT